MRSLALALPIGVAVALGLGSSSARGQEVFNSNGHYYKIVKPMPSTPLPQTFDAKGYFYPQFNTRQNNLPLTNTRGIPSIAPSETSLPNTFDPWSPKDIYPNDLDFYWYAE